jgi:L-asparagine transporter-like permease
MIKKLIIFSLLLLIIALLWNHFLPEELHAAYAIYILIYFFVVTLVVHRLLIKANKRSPQNFVRTYMGSTGIRLLLNLLVIFVYILIDHNRAARIGFALSFLFFYFAFQIFEVSSLMKELGAKRNDHI